MTARDMAKLGYQRGLSPYQGLDVPDSPRVTMRISLVMRLWLVAALLVSLALGIALPVAASASQSGQSYGSVRFAYGTPASFVHGVNVSAGLDSENSSVCTSRRGCVTATEWMYDLSCSLVAPSGAVGFTDDAVGSAFQGLRGGGGHASRHLVDEGLIPNSGSLASRVQLFEDLTTPLLTNPAKTFDWRLGNTATCAFAGDVGGAPVAGQTDDPGTGLIDYNARPYDPTLGRFVQADTVLAGLNRYTYVLNNPLRYTDPTGHCPGGVCIWSNETTVSLLASEFGVRPPAGSDTNVVHNKVTEGGASSTCGVGANSGPCPTKKTTTPDPTAIDSGLEVFGSIARVGIFDDRSCRASGGTGGLEIDAGCVAETVVAGCFGPVKAACKGGGKAASTAVKPAKKGFRWVRKLFSGACSFSGETNVLMADGSMKPIGEIEVGDWVLAEDPETGERGERQITHLWVHEDILVDLEIEGGAVATTEDHPFWNATDVEWQRADALDPGDLLLSADGDRLTIDGIDWLSGRTTTAYNLTVEGIHTYFVRVGDDEVLVHNVCGDDLVSDILKTKKGSIRNAELPSGAPSWDEILDMPFSQIEAGARANLPGYKIIKKLLTDGRFNR